MGKNLRGGEVIELISDLGGGKTTFVRGLARGMGSTDKVASPTFTVSKEYHSPKPPKLRLVHYDFYRLTNPGIMQFELAETLSDTNSVAVIEWADIVHDVLPESRVTINIKSVSGSSENARQLEVSYPPELSYLFNDFNTDLDQGGQQ